MADKKAGCLKLVGIFLAGTVVLSLIAHAGRSGHQSPSDGPSDEASTDQSEATGKAAHAKQINFAMEAGRALHASMRDPDSLVIELGKVSDDASLACVQYRARNGFNGMNREFIAYDGNGKPHQNAGYWNAHCKKPMADMTFAVTYGLSH